MLVKTTNKKFKQLITIAASFLSNASDGSVTWQQEDTDCYLIFQKADRSLFLKLFLGKDFEEGIVIGTLSYLDLVAVAENMDARNSELILRKSDLDQDLRLYDKKAEYTLSFTKIAEGKNVIKKTRALTSMPKEEFIAFLKNAEKITEPYQYLPAQHIQIVQDLEKLQLLTGDDTTILKFSLLRKNKKKGQFLIDRLDFTHLIQSFKIYLKDDVQFLLSHDYFHVQLDKDRYSFKYSDVPSNYPNLIRLLSTLQSINVFDFDAKDLDEFTHINECHRLSFSMSKRTEDVKAAAQEDLRKYLSDTSLSLDAFKDKKNVGIQLDYKNDEIKYTLVDLIHCSVINRRTVNYYKFKQLLECFYPETFKIHDMEDAIKIEGNMNEIYLCTIDTTVY